MIVYHGGHCVIEKYEYTPPTTLDFLKFDTMTDEWLDSIVDCRSGKPHNHAIVEGAMANDQVWNYIADFVSGVLTREQFCTPAALDCLKYLKSYEVGI